MKGKVIVGMSGGVDSSVAALLLKEEGYEVIGATYDFWHDDDEPKDIYRNLIDASEALAVAETIGIRHVAENYTKEFRANVEDHFIREYLSGRTPNPCVVCNPLVKWAAMIRTAERFGAEYVATGHYGRIERLDNGRYSVKNSVTTRKDQTYVLYGLSQEQLARTLMPVGDHDKDEIRRIAGEHKLPVADKPDSQEICFVDDGDYAGYIDGQLHRFPDMPQPTEGDFTDNNGKVLGTHKGITHYTIGQRRGLNIAAGHRIFVTGIDPASNRVILGENEELYTDRVSAGDVRYMAIEGLSEGEERRVVAKIRYNHSGTAGILRPNRDGGIEVIFDEPVRAATPGQSMVCYEDGHVLCGGVIR